MQLDESLMPDQKVMQITSSIHEMLGCMEVVSSIKVFDVRLLWKVMQIVSSISYYRLYGKPADSVSIFDARNLCVEIVSSIELYRLS